MKLTLIFIILMSVLNASIEIKQNMRALYKGVQLNEVQENYILDNQDENIDIFEKALKKEIKQFKSLSEKNIVKFFLTPAGEIDDIKFLKTSSNRKLDNATKKAINKVAKKLVKPQEKIEIRYIISYRVGQETSDMDYSNSQQQTTRETYYQTISNGTTRFQHTSKEYVRVFETRKDGFVNASASPQTCTVFKLLTYDNQHIPTGYTGWQFNIEIPKGKYKLLMKTNKTCDVHLQYK